MADREFVKFRYPITAETTATLAGMEYATDFAAQIAYTSSDPGKIQVYSESVIIQEGNYSLKIVSQNGSLGEVMLHNVVGTNDVSGKNSIKFYAFATAYGEIFNIRIHDATGVDIVDQSIPVRRVNQWVEYVINISAIADVNKSNLDEFEFQSNSNTGSVIYIDNLYASSDQDVVIITSNAFDLPDDITKLSNVVKTQAISGVNQRSKLGASRDSLNWNFPSLSRADFANLVNFLDTYTDWDLNPFEVTNLIENETTNVFLESWSTRRSTSRRGSISLSMIERIAS